MHRSPPRPSGRHAAAAHLTVAVALAGALAVTGAPPAWAGTAAARAAVTSTDTSPPQVKDVRFSRTSVAVAGLAVVPVTVSVHLTDTSGVAEIPYDMSPSPQLTLSTVPGFGSRLRPVLSRTSGTATDGTWSATVNVPSTWNGTVRITAVDAVDRAGNRLSDELTAARSPALRVTGTHRPALTFRYALLAGGGFRIHGRAYFTDTRRPIRRLPLATAYDSNCDFDGGAVNDIVTDARGYYQKRWRNGETAAAGCVALIGAAAPKQRPTLLAYHVASAPQPSIPAAALLQPEDLRGATPTPVTDDYWSAMRPPQPCADAPYPSAALRRADRAVSALIGVDDRPTVVMEHVATYRSNGAHRYLRELRRALAACDGLDQHDPHWTVLGTGVAGDESLVLRLREYIDFADTYKDSYLVVARVGRVLVVLADTGWETAGGHLALVRELSTTAVRRAAILNRR
jgi:hypothetical protein